MFIAEVGLLDPRLTECPRKTLDPCLNNVVNILYDY